MRSRIEVQRLELTTAPIIKHVSQLQGQSYSCGSHEALTIYLTSKDADSSETVDQQTRKRLSVMLTNMKTQRHIADYQLDIAFTKNRQSQLLE